MATTKLTPDLDAIIGEVFIAAPPARVFQAMTDPEQVPRWWGQQGCTESRSGKAMCDQVESGRVSGSGRTANHFASKANTWKSIRRACSRIPGSRTGEECRKRWFAGNWRLLIFQGLHPGGPKRAGTGTLVKIRHTGFAGAPEDAKNHSDGWVRVLGWMQAFAETGETVDTRSPIASARS